MQALVSLEWATDYFAYFRPKADEWDAVDGTERRRYLGWASVLIRSAFVWQDNVDVENDDRIRVATCEQALWLMRRTDQYPAVLTQGIASASVGSGAASATFSKDFVAPLVCDEAKLAIGDAGYLAKNIAVVKTMPLGGIWAETKPSGSKPLPKPPCKCPTGGTEDEACGNTVLNTITIDQILQQTGFPRKT